MYYQEGCRTVVLDARCSATRPLYDNNSWCLQPGARTNYRMSRRKSRTTVERPPSWWPMPARQVMLFWMWSQSRYLSVLLYYSRAQSCTVEISSVVRSQSRIKERREVGAFAFFFVEVDRRQQLGLNLRCGESIVTRYDRAAHSWSHAILLSLIL